MTHESENMSHNADSDQSVSHKLRTVQKIISGGQTGTDRAALDFAIEPVCHTVVGVRRAGRLKTVRLQQDNLLTETPTSSYPQRTEWNVRDSDGSVILSLSPLTGGSKKTIDFAIKHFSATLRASFPGRNKCPDQ